MIFYLCEKGYCENNMNKGVFSEQTRCLSSDSLASCWLSDNGDGTYTNCVFTSDYPDCDIIRVDDTYYFSSTSMHLYPGSPILSSKDLVHWKYESYALPYDQLLPLANEGHTLDLKNGHGYDMGAWGCCCDITRKQTNFISLLEL